MILIATVYLGIVALGLALLTRSSASRIGLALIVVLPALSFAVWQAAQPPTGWPARVSAPKTAQFQWGVIREPDQLTGDPGEIDLWLTPPGATVPRAYRAPYTRQLHKQVEAATGAVKSGVHIGVREDKADKTSGRASVGRYVFYVLPPPARPSKTTRTP